jgi:hypothetical protein
MKAEHGLIVLIERDPSADRLSGEATVVFNDPRGDLTKMGPIVGQVDP